MTFKWLYNNFLQEFTKLTKLNEKNFKKLHKIGHENEKLFVKLDDSCVACDILKSENVMLVDKIKSLRE